MLKVDIEGMDVACVADILRMGVKYHALPKYISIEAPSKDYITGLVYLAYKHGYRYFKLVEQTRYYRNVVNPAFRGAYGTFGDGKQMISVVSSLS